MYGFKKIFRQVIAYYICRQYFCGVGAIMFYNLHSLTYFCTPPFQIVIYFSSTVCLILTKFIKKYIDI
jgi:hypothetical protein